MKHQEDQNRPEIDREELDSRLRGISDGAEEGPRGAIDSQGKRVDQRLVARDQADGLSIAPVGDEKQQGKVGHRAGKDDFIADQSFARDRRSRTGDILPTRAPGCQAQRRGRASEVLAETIQAAEEILTVNIVAAVT